jgi:hypothetical protein
MIVEGVGLMEYLVVANRFDMVSVMVFDRKWTERLTLTKLLFHNLFFLWVLGFSLSENLCFL